MNERDRLIELLRAEMPTECDNHEDCIGCPYEFDVEGCFKSLAASTADHLLANGVIVPPVKAWFDKIGDDVYVIDEGEVVEGILCTIGLASPTKSYVTIIYDRGFEDEHCFEFEFSDFGKTVFLTREEAERVLKEREQE